ncbi:MAG: hypothetical protein ACMG6H_15925 [Acidobacteriota bacterium]
MLIKKKARPELMNVNRIEDAAMTLCRSGEVLFRYYLQLDALQGAELSHDVLTERAREAELHARMLLGAGIDAVNELNDLGLLNAAPTDEQINFFNKTKLTDAVNEAIEMLRQRLPNERWEWLKEASRLVEGVDMRIERSKEGTRATVTRDGRSKLVHFDPAAPVTRVSTRAFFSDGLERIYVPTSSLSRKTNGESEPMAAYDALIGGFAFAREWMYRHSRYVAELGPPARTGGGPAWAVIAVVLIYAALTAAVLATIFGILCLTEGTQSKSCVFASFFGSAAGALTWGGTESDKQAKQFQYGTNPQ